MAIAPPAGAVALALTPEKRGLQVCVVAGLLEVFTDPQFPIAILALLGAATESPSANAIALVIILSADGGCNLIDRSFPLASEFLFSCNFDISDTTTQAMRTSLQMILNILFMTKSS